MSANKKILNATKVDYGDLRFDSKLEKACYRELVLAGFNPQHHCEKITLLKGIKPDKVHIYQPDKEERLSRNTVKLKDMTYEPDFKVETEHLIAYIETKGFPDAKYPIKKKAFLKWFERLDDSRQRIFLEPHSVRQCSQAIQILKSYEEIK